MTPASPLCCYKIISFLIRPFIRLLPDSLEPDERRKRLMTIAGSLIGIPVLIYFTIIDILNREQIGIVLDGGLAILLFVCLFPLSKAFNGIWIYRILISALSVLLCYNSLLAPSGESSVLWLMMYPPIVLFILGIPEGLLWFCCIFLLNLTLILFRLTPATAIYSTTMISRFFISMSIIAFFSFAYELLRWRFYSQLEHRTHELEDALENVRTLRGLLPICSTCKRIRDDKGYWNQLEEYLSTHTEVTLTHGICSACMKKYYPDIYRKKMEQERMNSKSAVKQG